jgi:hypothetical protein
MRFSPLPLVAVSAVLLAACNAPHMTSIDQELQNPLTASRYGDELADGMANIIIQDDPILKEDGVREKIENEIRRGKEISADAQDKQSEGVMGGILPMGADSTGYALYVDGTLFLSSDFSTTPGPSLHVYLTNAIDPRDVEFPDESALDLGEIQSAFGAQQYEVPEQKEGAEPLRTFVLFDKTLKRIYGFAQLSKR